MRFISTSNKFGLQSTMCIYSSLPFGTKSPILKERQMYRANFYALFSITFQSLVPTKLYHASSRGSGVGARRA